MPSIFAAVSRTWVQRLDHFDAARLAAATGMNLRLDHPLIAADLASDLDGRFWRAGDRALRHRNSELHEQFLRLVLVEVHPVS